MYLPRLELRYFKAYQHAVFDFPRPTSENNVILIGGLNGYGKTTLFEALVLGLFGRDGIRLVTRARPGADEQERARSYAEFMQRVLFGGALQQGRTSCSVKLIFEEHPKRPIELVRRWHYSDKGRYQPTYDELQIFEGIQRTVVEPDGNIADPWGFYREWIFDTFLPVNQADFFLFDGEAAAIYAERDMAQQIRESIEGILGLSWLRKLAETLRAYATNRRQHIPGVNSAKLEVLRREIEGLDNELRSSRKELDIIKKELDGLEREQDRIIRELAGYGPATQADLNELLQKKKDLEKQIESAAEQLIELVSGSLPFALIGTDLREGVSERLQRERAREQWLAAREQSKARIEAVVEELERGLDELIPPLSEKQRWALRGLVERALDRLWNPPPPNVAEEFRHPHATGPFRERILSVLQGGERLRQHHIEDTLQAWRHAAAELRETQRQIETVESRGPEGRRKEERFKEIQMRINNLQRRRGQLENLIKSREPELMQKQKEYARLSEALAGSQPVWRRIARAEKVASMLDDLVGEAWQLCARAIAEAMSESIRSMTHRDDYLHRVEIEVDGSVRLLSREGRDIREFDLSAGEKQIFTQALFAAVARISRKKFPIVVDTPLGRLDQQHRINILRHLAARDAQVILLSTNTEVVGTYLEAIRPRILKTYRLESREIGDLRESWPVEGYFDGAEL